MMRQGPAAKLFAHFHHHWMRWPSLNSWWWQVAQTQAEKEMVVAGNAFCGGVLVCERIQHHHQTDAHERE
jgi:hypothetical protein